METFLLLTIAGLYHSVNSAAVYSSHKCSGKWVSLRRDSQASAAPPSPPSFQASACRARINLQSPLSLERLSSPHGALFLFSLSCPSWFPSAECYLQIVGAVGYFYDKVSKYPGDEKRVFREHKSNFSHLFSVG